MFVGFWVNSYSVVHILTGPPKATSENTSGHPEQGLRTEDVTSALFIKYNTHQLIQESEYHKQSSRILEDGILQPQLEHHALAMHFDGHRLAIHLVQLILFSS